MKKVLVFIFLLVLSFQSIGNIVTPKVVIKKPHPYTVEYYFGGNWGLSNTKTQWGNGFSMSSKSADQLAAYTNASDTALVQWSREDSTLAIRYSVGSPWRKIATTTILSGYALTDFSNVLTTANLLIPSGLISAGGLTVSGNISGSTIAATLTTGTQPNIISVGSLTSLTVIGRTITGSLSTTGNISGAGLTLTSGATVGGNISITGSITAANSYINIITAGGLSGGTNVLLGGTITITGSSGSGSGITLTGTPNQIDISAPNGNSTASLSTNLILAGTLSTTGIGSFGGLTVSGNISALTLGGTLLTASQPNITLLGTLTGLTIAGYVSMGGNNIIGGGDFTANNFIGTLIGNASSASSVANALTMNSGGSGASSGTTFNGSVARTISYNTIGAVSTSLSNVSVTANLLNTSGLISTGGLTVSGNISGSTIGGTLTTGTQTNITSLGTLTGLTVSGGGDIGGGLTVTGGEVLNGGLTITGSIMASNIYWGNSGGLLFPLVGGTGIFTSGQIQANNFVGTISTGAQPNITSLGSLTSLTVSGRILTNSLSTTGNISAGGITASGGITSGPIQATSTTGIALRGSATTGNGAYILNNSSINSALDVLNSGNGNIATFGNSGGTTATIYGGGITTTGIISAAGITTSGAVNAGSLTTAGTLTVAGQSTLNALQVNNGITMNGATSKLLFSGITSASGTYLPLVRNSSTGYTEEASSLSLTTLTASGAVTAGSITSSGSVNSWGDYVALGTGKGFYGQYLDIESSATNSIAIVSNTNATGGGLALQGGNNRTKPTLKMWGYDGIDSIMNVSPEGIFLFKPIALTGIVSASGLTTTGNINVLGATVGANGMNVSGNIAMNTHDISGVSVLTANTGLISVLTTNTSFLLGAPITPSAGGLIIKNNAGTTNNLTLSDAGNLNLAGNLTTTGNIQAASITSTGGISGVLTTAQQPNITGIGNLSGSALLTLGGTGSSANDAEIRLRTGSGKYAFQFAAQNNINNAWEITPSTAVGGTTFNNPSISGDNNGIITFNQYGTGAAQLTAGVLSVISDSKIKDKGGFLKGTALDLLMKIPKPEYWNYNKKSLLPEKTWKVRQFGLYADSVHFVLGEEFAPTQPQSKQDSLTNTKNYGLSDRALLSLTIQALQEANKKIEAQEARFAKLEAILLKSKIQ